tara:strand:- start:2435 stop:2776 length:342 start_codon:yes stop_codon:yes gene_type:complete
MFFSIAFNFIKDTSFISYATRIKSHNPSKKIQKKSLSSMVLKGAKILGIKKCLVISLVIYRIFKKHGYNAKLAIGWHIKDKFSSHSWVESNSEYFPASEIENSKKYKKIKVFQ